MRWPTLVARCVLIGALLGTPSSLAAAPPAAAQLPGAQPLERPVWLCRPGLPDNPCNQDADGNPQRTGPGGVYTQRYVSGGDVTLDATRVPVSGPTTAEAYDPPADPPVDCFYVYPTVDIVPNPPLQVGSLPPTAQDHHMAATLTQASRFANVCRLFVPVYRQVPLPVIVAAILAGVEPNPQPGLMDVEQAWQEYWDDHNVDPATGQRRGVVLLGHSQGSANLIHLVRTQVDGNAEMQDQLVSAVLLGADVFVPIGEPAGGGSDPASTFQHVPACERASASAPVPVGCVVAYSSYAQRGSDPPVAGALFGRSTVAGHQVLCVNPAALLAGTPGAATTIDTYLATRRQIGGGPLNPYGYLGPILAGWAVPDYPSGYARYPDRLQGQCRFVEDGTGNWSWLQVTGGDDLFPLGTDLSPLGLHLVDVNLTLGNLTTLVALQSDAWLQQQA